MPDRFDLDPGQPRVHPDDYPKAGLGEFQPPTQPQVVTDPERDQRLASEIRAHLAQSPMVQHERVQVNVVNAEVFLTGIVENRFARNRAEELCTDIEGVAKVVNKISIQPTSDEVGPVLSTHAAGTHKGGSTQRS